MRQSTWRNDVRGIHVAIIMDGNGRWASRRGEPRTAGHRAGAEAVRRAVEAAGNAGVGTLSLFAMSSANFTRPAGEVQNMFRLFDEFLAGEVQGMRKNGVRLRVIGRRDRIPRPVRAAIEATEHATAGGDELTLRLAVDYSSRDAITRAASAFSNRIAATLEAVMGYHPDGEPSVPVDLLIRTGGERRLSDFLLWECAYAELTFMDIMWPDFTQQHFEVALHEYARRVRTFGGTRSPLVTSG